MTRQTMARWAGTVLAAGALLLTGACGNDTDGESTASPTTSVAPVAAGSVRIDGAVQQAQELTREQLKGFPAHTEAVTYTSKKGEQSHTYVGALLADVVAAAKPITDADAKNPEIRLAVLATGADGYQATVAWGEFDSHLANVPILVAYDEDGKALETPRLVVPSDTGGARYVSDLTTLTVVDLGDH